MALILLDRDGVINVNRDDYVKTPSELIIYDEAFEAIRYLKHGGYSVAVITNQSAVGRGIISKDELDKIHNYMVSQIFAETGYYLEHIYQCLDAPHKATYRRKPNPGMLEEAIHDFHQEPESVIFIGDSLSDLQAAKEAGCKPVLVLTGHGKKTLLEIEEKDFYPLEIYPDILQAVRGIV